MDRRDYLKPSRFGNTEKRRLLDTKNLKEKRSIRRTTNFNLRRDINDIAQELNKNSNENIPPKASKVLDRKLALQKFRAEREAQKKTLKNLKKPPFIVGIPHHGSSPLLRDLKAENTTKKVTKASTTQEVRSKRVTRATTRTVGLQGNVLKEKPKVNGQSRNIHVFKAPPSVRVFPFKDNKSMFTFQAYKVPQSEKKLTSPHTPTVLKRSVQKKPLKNVSNLVKKLKKSPESSNSSDADEELAAPLTSEEVDETAAVGETQVPIKIELLEDDCIPGTSDLVKADQINDEVTDKNGEDNDHQNSLHMSHLKTNLRRNPKRSHRKDANEDLPALSPKPKVKSEEEGHEVAAVGEAQKRKETLENVTFLLTEESEMRKDDEGNNNKEEDIELADQVAFQHGRLQSETTRLVELADQWQTVVLRETLPQDVVDEVDSVVGQTRLLTSDKFQQFRRIVVQYEQKTGTHPVTWDDLNGFWDMVYLQVESLDKKYAALDALRNNNWVKPEQASRKKRHTAKMIKSNKVTQKEKFEKLKIHLQAPEDKQLHTPTTNMKPVTSSVLLKKNRTCSNSPSPYIAMRLSGIGRNSNIMAQLPATDGTPRSKLVLAEAPGTPKSALKKSWTRLTDSTTERTSTSKMSSIEVKVEEAVEDTERLTAAEEQLVPAMTPRRSMRLMTKLQTPSRCSACESASCERSQCNRSTQRSSQRQSRRQAVSPVEELLETTTKPDCTKNSASRGTRNSKILKFSPSESQQESDIVAVTELTQQKETDLNKPSTSGVRFSLRPSILTVSEIPKKATTRRQASLSTANTSPEGQDAEELGAKSRRSTRQSRKVTFESGIGGKRCFKLPATPYRKYQDDS